MMEFFGDIAFSSKTGSVFHSLESYGEPAAKASDAPVIAAKLDNAPWSRWGNNNRMPEEIGDDLENCGVLAAAADAKARIGTGKGMQPFLLTNISSDGKEDLEWVSDSEIQEWIELNDGFEFAFDSSYDNHGYGWNTGSYVTNLGRNKIYRVKRHDVFEARLEKKESLTRRINNIYLSADWANATGQYDPDKQTRIELLEEGNELQDLTERIAGNSNKVEFAFCNRKIRNGRHYYPIPIYRSNKAWIKIARSIPAFKIAMFKNSITILQEVIIHPKFWEDKFGQTVWNKYSPEEKKKYQDEYYLKIDNWLSGEDQAFKTLFTGGFVDPVKGEFIPYIKVVPIDNKIKDGQFLPDSGAANSEILFALMINPALMGAGNPGGKAYGDTSGGSNVRESFLVQLMIMESERRMNASVFNVVKYFNGWAKRLQTERTITTSATLKDGSISNTSRIVTPRLVFRYPSGLLTTLDTGKSTKPENL